MITDQVGWTPLSCIIFIINGNKTEWGPIQSVIMLVIKQILITRMITDRIGLHSVLLPLLIMYYT